MNSDESASGSSGDQDAAVEAGSSPGVDEDLDKYYLMLFQSGLRTDPKGSLDRNVVYIVKEHLERIESPPAATSIDVWLESPGGDASAAYKLFLCLRSKCHKLRVVVPDYAKSAATLFVLGCDEIFMGPAAELGPLDVQIEHPDRENYTVSGLDVAKPLGFLADFAVDFIIRGGREVLDFTELARLDVLKEFAKFSASFLEPTVAKLDPHLIHRAHNQLEIAVRYASIMLNGRKLDGAEEEGLSPEDLARHLVNDYPSHEFVISRDEARHLGLPVRNERDYDKWPCVQQLHKMFLNGHFSTTDTYSAIALWSRDELAEASTWNEQEGRPEKEDE